MEETKTISSKELTQCLEAQNGSSNSTYYLNLFRTKDNVVTFIGADYGEGITTTENEECCLWARIVIPAGKTVNNVVFKPKIDKGTKKTGYSQFGQGSVSVTIGNGNLAKTNTLTNVNTLLDTPILNGGETYTISFNSTTTGGLNLRVNSVVGKVIATMYPTIGYNEKTFVMPEDGKLYINGWDFKPSGITDLMLKIGSTDTPHIEHQEQNYTIPVQKPFRSCGTYRDTFIKKEGKRYEIHYIARRIFDGSEKDWFAYQDSDAFKYVYGINSASFKLGTQTSMCSHFKNVNGVWTASKGKIGYYCDHPTVSNKYFATDKATLEEWKAYLAEQYNAGTPVYIDYILKEPELIPCTEEQNAILDQIDEQAHTYKNVTHISSTDEVSPYFNIECRKDLDTIHKQQDDRTTALEDRIIEIETLLSTTATSALLLDNMQTDLESEV